MIVKPVVFLGTSRDDLRSFSAEVRSGIGFALESVQLGEAPPDWKPMPTIGAGVRELRVRVADGAFRTIYVLPNDGVIYVLHVFQKRSQKTAQRDLQLAKTRLALIPKGTPR